MADEKPEEEIRKHFQEHSVAEFFKKNRQMLGYSGKIKSLTTVIHEFLTNSLDACEDAKILPDIYARVDKLGEEHYKVTVEDNGPGLPKELIGRAFGKMLAGTKFHRFVQGRGQQGIGASGCIMFSQITTGKPTKITVSTGNGRIYQYVMMIDAAKNEPRIMDEKEKEGKFRGVRAELEVKDVLCQKGDQGVFEYIKRTALANPHAKITYVDPEGEKAVFERAVKEVPGKPQEVQPHPKGVSADDVISMAHRTVSRNVRSFLANEFARVSSAKADEVCRKSGVSQDRKPSGLEWHEAEKIVKAFQATDFIAPSAEGLRPIGEEHLQKALENVLKPEFFTVLTRPPAIYRGGIPFIVEAALAYGGGAGREGAGGKREMEVMRSANRAPLLFDASGCGIVEAVKSIDWKRYNVRDESEPLTVFVNLISAYVPYTSAGKQSIAGEEEIVKEIRLALMDVGRRLDRYLSGKRKRGERELRRRAFEKYIPPIAEALSGLTGVRENTIAARLQKLVATKYEENGDIKENVAVEGVK